MAMSTADLLAYVRGTGDDGRAHAQAELLADPYAASAYGAGILSSDYRAAIYNSPLAKTLRWFVKLDTTSGERYEEQQTALNGSLVADVRCLVWETTIQLESAEYGQELQTATMLSVLPEEIEMDKGDLVLLTQPASARTAFNRFDRTAAAVQVLPHWPCTAIFGVWVEGVRLPATAYSAVPDGIQWGVGAPAVGARFSVRWKYLPLFQWDEDEQGTLQLGADGLPLPQQGRVHLIQNFDKTKIL